MGLTMPHTVLGYAATILLALASHAEAEGCAKRTKTQSCIAIKDRATCLESVESRDLSGLPGGQIQGKWCGWCPKGACTNGGNQCEPDSFLVAKNIEFESCLKDQSNVVPAKNPARNGGAVAGLDGQTSNQNVWLQMSPYPRPVYGWNKADQEEKPKCVFVKGKEKINVYGAMLGYDSVRGNPLNSLSDPGVMERIFYHDCKFGYFDFVSRIISELNCDSDFSMKTISSMDEYESERTSSNKFSIKASVDAEGSGFGISAKASLGYSRATNADESAAETVLSKLNGELSVAKATCLTHAVSISRFVRPVFTSDFIRGLVMLDEATDVGNINFRENAVAEFIREFGTHFSKTTHLGAQLLYERRFNKKATSRSDKSARSACTKDEARASVSGGGYGVKVAASVEGSNEDCNSVKQGSAFAADEGFEQTKTISRGSRPKSLKSWIDAAFTPVPIERELEKITELFKDDWMKASVPYGFEKSLRGRRMKSMFDEAAKKYCQIMLPGMLDENCEVIVCQGDANKCTNGGTCYAFEGKAKCSCLPQFSGKFCEESRVNGGWGQWSSQSLCSAQCGGGQVTRKRKCDNPTPRNGGETCSGVGFESQPCNTIPCEDMEAGFKLLKSKECLNMADIYMGTVESGKKGRATCASMCAENNHCRGFQWTNEVGASDNCILSTRCTEDVTTKGRDIFWVYIKEHDNCPTIDDYNLSKITSKTEMEKNGWYFDPNFDGGKTPFDNTCTSNIGKLTARFQGFGSGKIQYGSCRKGRVKVLIDGNPLSDIDANTQSKTVEFDFTPYTKLELQESEGGMIRIDSLEIGCRGYVAIVHKNAWECKSANEFVGKFETEVKYLDGDKEAWTKPVLCAHFCIEKYGYNCNFLGLGWDNFKGECLWEKPSSGDCSEGFNGDASFAFMAIRRLGCEGDSDINRGCPADYRCSTGGRLCAFAPSGCAKRTKTQSCIAAKDRATCLISVESRDISSLPGGQIQGKWCGWCPNGACTDGGNQCEPDSFLYAQNIKYESCLNAFSGDFTLHGQGYCTEGYYAGGAEPSEEACKKRCMDERECTYVAYVPNAQCARYKANFCPLTVHDDLASKHTTFKKNQ